MSVYWDILSEVQTQIRDNVTLTGVGTTKGVDSDAVVIRNMQHGDDGRGWDSDEKTPGIVISPSVETYTPLNEADNCTNDVHYPVYLQVIDINDDRFDEDKLKSWLNWHEALRKYFHHNDLQMAVFGSPGYVNRVVLPKQRVLESREFFIHDKSVGVLFLEVISREPRDQSGSS